MPSNLHRFALRGLLAGFLASALLIPGPALRAAEPGAYVAEATAALSGGGTLASASKEALIAAIQKVILAHPPAEAPAIAAALVDALPINRAVEVAEAIGRLFASHPEIAQLAPDIGREMAIRIDAKTPSSPAEDGYSEKARAQQIGYVTSTLAYFLNPADPKNEKIIASLVRQVLAVNPKLEYTRVIFGSLIYTLRAVGTSEAMLSQIENDVLDTVSDPTIRNQLRVELWNVYKGPDNFFPGAIVTEETPVTNR